MLMKVYNNDSGSAYNSGLVFVPYLNGGGVLGSVDFLNV